MSRRIITQKSIGFSLRDRCHTLAYVWQKKVDEAKKALEILKQRLSLEIQS